MTSGPTRRRAAGRDRLLATLARFITRRFFRSIETVGACPPDGPVVLAASHLNGFVDPVLLVGDLGLLPRFLAKATLWKSPVVRPFLSFARLIPVHRAVDSADGKVDNDATFASAVEALRDGHLLALFPEGTTHDEPTLRPLRTGAARIARQAARHGVEGVRVVPVGILYEDKVAVRGRVLIEYGTPLDVVAEPDLPEEEDHAEVRALTEDIRVSLAALSTDFATTEEAIALTAAADVALREQADATGLVPMADMAALARQLAAQDDDTVERIVTRVARYLMFLGHLGLSDRDLVHHEGPRRLLRQTIVLAVLVVLLAPMAVGGLFANLVPAILVLVAGLVPEAPVSKGTFRVLVAMVTFPLTWLVIAIFNFGVGPVPDDGGVLAGIVVFLLCPIFGIVALFVLDRFRALLHRFGSWRTLVDRRGQLPEVREARADLVAYVNEVTGMGAAA